MSAYLFWWQKFILLFRFYFRSLCMGKIHYWNASSSTLVFVCCCCCCCYWVSVCKIEFSIQNRRAHALKLKLNLMPGIVRLDWNGSVSFQNPQPMENHEECVLFHFSFVKPPSAMCLSVLFPLSLPLCVCACLHVWMRCLTVCTSMHFVWSFSFAPRHIRMYAVCMPFVSIPLHGIALSPLSACFYVPFLRTGKRTYQLRNIVAFEPFAFVAFEMLRPRIGFKRTHTHAEGERGREEQRHAMRSYCCAFITIGLGADVYTIAHSHSAYTKLNRIRDAMCVCVRQAKK